MCGGVRVEGTMCGEVRVNSEEGRVSASPTRTNAENTCEESCSSQTVSEKTYTP